MSSDTTAPKSAFEVGGHGLKDSGERVVSETGFTKEPDTSRPDYSWLSAPGLDLVPGELIERVATHYDRGAAKYAPNNWKLGTDPDSLARFKRSAARHFVQWMRGETDEDHFAAVVFNLTAFEVCSANAESL